MQSDLVINLNEMRELQRIRGLLQSNDPESQALGFNLLKSNEVFNKIRWKDYINQTGTKTIPVNWYVNKASEIFDHDKVVETGLILPILDDMITGRCCFVGTFSVRFDKNFDD